MQAPFDPIVPPQRSPIIYNRKGVRSGWRLLAWFALSVAGSIAVMIPLSIVLMAATAAGAGLQGASPPAWLALSGEGIIFAPVFLAAVIVALTMENRPVRSLGFALYPGSMREFTRGLLFGVGMLSGVMLILTCLGAYRIGGFQEGLLPALGWGIAMAFGFLGVGALEEFTCRGYLLQNLTDGIGAPAAAVITSLFFMLPHLANRGENPLGICDVLLAGISLLVLVVRTRSLWMAVGLHAAWDWSQNFLFGVADSGMVLPGGLLRCTAHGPAWLTGGAAGPEGSVVALIVDGLSILYFARARWIRPSPEAASLWADYVSPKKEPEPPAPPPDLPAFVYPPPLPPMPDFDLDAPGR